MSLDQIKMSQMLRTIVKEIATSDRRCANKISQLPKHDWQRQIINLTRKYFWKILTDFLMRKIFSSSGKEVKNVNRSSKS